MPRRRNRQLCECGCGQMTETGKFLRGHATRLRWKLINEAETGSNPAREELQSRKWVMPASRRTFGIEFELVSLVSGVTLAESLIAAGISVYNYGSYERATSRPQWTIKTDSSIKKRNQGNFAYEIVSPVLRGKAGEREVRKVLAVLNAHGCKVNTSCGTHVHIGASDLYVDGIRRVAETYDAHVTELDMIFPKSRRQTAKQAQTYCKRRNHFVFREMKNAETVRDLAYASGGRYHTVNLMAYPRQATIEFRQHQGTLNADKILAWMGFCRKLVQAAGKSEVQTDGHLLTLMNKIKTDRATTENLYERLRNAA